MRIGRDADQEMLSRRCLIGMRIGIDRHPTLLVRIDPHRAILIRSDPHLPV